MLLCEGFQARFLRNRSNMELGADAFNESSKLIGRGASRQLILVACPNQDDGSHFSANAVSVDHTIATMHSGPSFLTLLTPALIRLFTGS